MLVLDTNANPNPNPNILSLSYCTRTTPKALHPRSTPGQSGSIAQLTQEAEGLTA
jgi:hypothetical protein